MRHGYFANVAYLDAQLGKVLAALNEHKLADNTVIVFVADHGYHLGEHGLWAKTSCFELDARVPLIVVPPKAAQTGKTAGGPVELIDLFPTLTELCGLPAPPGLEGKSLVPALNDPAKSVKPAALTQHPRPAYYDRTEKGVPEAMGYSVRTARVRYTEWRDWATGKVLAAELYDHAGDPAETRNRIDAPPDAVALAEAKAALRQLAPSAPTKAEASDALKKAVRFFRTNVGRNGGYLWQYSGDLKLREAEGRVTSDTIVWVQPPGTPTIGEAFLDAYDATGDAEYLDAAKEVGAVLVKGQMRTGGWGYSIELDAEKRKAFAYRDVPAAGKVTRWNKATVLDDDTTSGAVRFLARLDRATGFKDKAVHDGVAYCAARLIAAQYPNGSWFGWWEYEPKPAAEADFPVKKASYPDRWARSPEELTERWPAKYVVNDDLMSDMILTWLRLWDVYKDDRYLAAAKKAGGFLLLAQLPEPQPAWAQQYDIDMRPCWGRKFEPPAVTGAESQTNLETLMLLYRRTGDRKYLDPIPAALAYLKKSVLPNGRLSRFYELKTNRPLYFDTKYILTYSKDDLPTHYAFEVASRLAEIEKEYDRLRTAPAAERARPPADPFEAGRVIGALDARGAWVEKGSLRFPKVEPASGVVRCQTFADNVATLARFIKE